MSDGSKEQGKIEIEIVYDGKCPVCTTYCCALQRPENVELVDARLDSEIMRDITRRGLDIDEGMVVKADGKLYYGSEAMREIARRLPRKGWTGLVNRLFFSSAGIARVAYDVCKAGRSVLLKLLRIKKIENLKGGDRG